MKRLHTAIAIFAAAALSPAPAPAQFAAEEAEPQVVTDPTLRAVLETPRDTPGDYARALFALINLREPARAQEVLTELLALNLEDDAKAALVTEFGSAAFVQLSRTEGLGPEAAAFATDCLTAAKAQSIAPNRMAELVDKLSADSAQTQAVALAALRRTGAEGVRYCVTQIAAAEDADRNPLREALVALAPLSRPALVAMLESSDADLRKQAAWALGKIRAESAAPLLAAQAVLEPTGSDPGRAAQWAFVHTTGAPATKPIATRLLDNALRNLRGGVPFERPNAAGEIAFYQRDKVEKVAANPVVLSTSDAGIAQAARLARLRLRLDPTSVTARRTAMVLHLQTLGLMEAGGVEMPEEELLDLSRVPSTEIGDALTDALELRYAGAAAALAVKLGERQNAAALATANGKPSPLAVAVNDPHPGVRWAALWAIDAIKPRSPFPGSSRVPSALIRFAGGSSARVAVVATPGAERSATLVGLLAPLGIEGRVATTGAQAVKAADTADLEFALVDLAVLGPNVRETVFRLRRQTASGVAPIGLLASAGRLEEAKRIAEDHQHVVAFPRPHTAEAVAGIAEQLAAAAPAGWPTADERAELAELARGRLADMLRAPLDPSSADGPTYYNLRGRSSEIQQALGRAGYSGAALSVLGLLGTPASQRELLTTASLRAVPIDSRRAAAKAFEESVALFGVLLTALEIQQQYDRYNASESADADTQALLGGVLDVIEAKRNRRQAVGSQ
ncbi:MAG: HEAT repeat domain-containing protein [Planctomycetota bacterium]